MRSLSSSVRSDRPRHPFARPSTSLPADEDVDSEERLPDVGIIVKLDPKISNLDVLQTFRYIQRIMFTKFPERASGMNSSRTSQLLNYRDSLPPLVTLAHLHAVLDTPSVTEREIARLREDGVLREVLLPGGGEGLVSLEDWHRLIDQSSELSDDTKRTYMRLLRAHPNPTVMVSSELSVDETRALMHAGFITLPSRSSSDTNILLQSEPGSHGTLASLVAVGSQQASGSLGAIGGSDAFHVAGGGGGGLYHRQSPSKSESISAKSRVLGAPRALNRNVPSEVEFSLPSIGSYLRLLRLSRAHLMSLLSKSKFKEAPVDLLRERWDGGVATDDSIPGRTKARGDYRGVLPGNTRKWKYFHGLSFEWVLGECLGSGLVELFETGSVGKGVRAR